MGPAYDKWSSKGLEIIAFPCNQFGKQEPGTPEEIDAFIRDKYSCKFPIMEKVEVNGENTHPVYAFLRNNSELYDSKTDLTEEISWNFAKFIVSQEGKVLKYFNPKISAKTALEFMEEYIEKN
jgi:glutathione peroxidase